MEKDPYIEEVKKELERLSNDPKRRLEYEAREDALRDYMTQMESFKREGKTEGKEEATMNVAMNALELGLSTQQIHTITGISIERIEELKSSCLGTKCEV